MLFQSSRAINIFFVIFACFFIASCLPEEPPEHSYKIIAGEVNGKIYHVPEAYFALPGDSISGDSIYVVAMYPEFSPPMEKPKELSKKGLWYKNVTILLLKRKSSTSFDEFAKGMIDHHKAFEVVKEEYDLIHQKQPKDEIQDNKDLWLERNSSNEFVSYISCSEKLNETSMPKCTHNYFNNDFRFKVSFDKRFLAEWKSIKRNTLALLESFESETTAESFLNTRLDLTNNGE